MINLVTATDKEIDDRLDELLDVLDTDNIPECYKDIINEAISLTKEKLIRIHKKYNVKED